ncbi:MAG TPA: thermonuclease family protein [Candidatus Pacearchaeota archaeon]|nr:thermonuclease family protein [Candidatus Pacearchaeota archaeon]
MIPVKSKLLINIFIVFLIIGAVMLIVFELQKSRKSDITLNIIDDNNIPDIYVKVQEVIDGDTIKVLIAGKTETVRLIGIDTPEVYKNPECYGKEASDYVKKILTDKYVYLSSDTKVGDRDEYGRILRYVFLPDYSLLNAKLVGQGYAFNFIYSEFFLMKYFSDLEQQAKKNKIGLWGICDF